MRVKNVNQVCAIPGFNLIAGNMFTRVDGETDEAYQAREDELRAEMLTICQLRNQGKPYDEQLAGALRDGLIPGYRDALKHYGVTLPGDNVMVTMTLGNLLFDLWNAVTPKSTAPVKMALQAREAQKLAAAFQSDEIELSDELIAKLRPATEDDEIWGRVPLTVFTRVGTDLVYFQLQSMVAGAFPQVLDAAIDIFLPK